MATLNGIPTDVIDYLRDNLRITVASSVPVTVCLRLGDELISMSATYVST